MRHIPIALVLLLLSAALLPAHMVVQGAHTAGVDASPGEVSLLFVGDVMLGRYVGSSIPRNNPDAPFKGITPFISSADLSIANLEGPLVPSGVISVPKPYPNLLNLTGDARMAAPLQRAGFDLVSLANNHVFDSRIPGLNYTTNALKRAGVAPFGLDGGHGQTAVVREVRGLRIAFLGYTSVMNIPGLRGVSIVNPAYAADRQRMASEIKAAKASADVVVVMMHWGTEYAYVPDNTQRTLTGVAAGAGADLVVGAHPHVSQGMEELTGPAGSTLVAYSLGNALFDQESRLELKQGLTLQCTVDRNGVRSARLVPLQIVRDREGYKMSVADNASGQTALQRASASTPAALQWKAVLDASRPGSPVWGIGLAYVRDDVERSSIENLGIGAATRVDLNDGALTVSTYVTGTTTTRTLRTSSRMADAGWKVVWSSDPGWRVTSYSVGDANADGKPDLMYTLWKKRLTWERPPDGGLDVDQQGGEMLPHIYINSWQNGQMGPLWHGSPRPAPVLAVAATALGKDGKPLLAVLESGNRTVEQAPGRVTLWEWTGGFGYELHTPLAGVYSQMWSDGKQLLVR